MSDAMREDELAALTTEDIANVREVLDSQLRLGHAMTLVPTDVLNRFVRAVRGDGGLDVERPCPWCGHPPMCHKGPEGECPAATESDG